MHMIELEVHKMLQKGAIRHALFHPFLIVLLSQRKLAILGLFNLKPLNEFVQYHHFKMEGLNSLLDLLSGSEFFYYN